MRTGVHKRWSRSVDPVNFTDYGSLTETTGPHSGSEVTVDRTLCLAVGQSNKCRERNFNMYTNE